MSRAQYAILPDGRRRHFQDGPIDLLLEAFGEPAACAAAYRAAAAAFEGLLDRLCADLPDLRRPAGPRGHRFEDRVAQAMDRAVRPFAAAHFITPMAAVAGAVADHILAAMVAAAPLARAYVNNGGDIALHLAPGAHFEIGLVDRPDRPSLFARATIGAGEPVRGPVRGIATSGWRGRSFSLGIADAVTVLGRNAAEADAAATLVANAVDLPGHPAIRRSAACELQPDSDLGSRPVTRAVGALDDIEIADALGAGCARAEDFLAHGLIHAAALHLQGRTQIVGDRNFAAGCALAA